MKQNVNIAILGLGQIGNFLLNELNLKKKEIETNIFIFVFIITFLFIK